MGMRDRAELTVLSEREAFTFRPNTIHVPFGADLAGLVVDLSKPFPPAQDRPAGVTHEPWAARFPEA
jgi:hypothetical protein